MSVKPWIAATVRIVSLAACVSYLIVYYDIGWTARIAVSVTALLWAISAMAEKE